MLTNVSLDHQKLMLKHLEGQERMAMSMTSDRLRCLLVISNAGDRLSHDDERLAPFCDDASTLTTPDIFNQCHDAGWLKTWHDDRTDSSTVELTKAGKAALGLTS